MTERLTRLIDVMARLRDPEGGCPWDIEQTFETIAPYTIEEAYEVADAIRQGDMPALRDELGDLLLQVVYHARMAEEKGHFDFWHVAGDIADKMVRRHPHVFGDAEIATVEAQSLNWEQHKAAERQARAEARGERPSALDGVPLALPALIRAEKIGKRAARVGFDWRDATHLFVKVEEEMAELGDEIRTGADQSRIAEELGDLLFTLANLARHLKIDPEDALRRTNAKVQARFRRMEETLAADDIDV
ncbi:MAG: nucleoside triphosphate pyrophosphohydrolase, partial [Alphaproteobacteria bacterium]|nr:nucleoside triphosphate pyrophosphohydrolase [Alphaproteobacteria bacterium]